jgi:hypothetical protein
MDWEGTVMKSRLHFDTQNAGRGRKAALVLVVLTLPLFLGAWKMVIGRDINPAYVERIQDGQTKRHEILTLFGDPHEIKRTPEALVYIYQSFRDKETLPKLERKTSKTNPDSPYFDENWQQRVSNEKTSSDQELASRLTIRFDRDGDTVQSHEYQQF